MNGGIKRKVKALVSQARYLSLPVQVERRGMPRAMAGTLEYDDHDAAACWGELGERIAGRGEWETEAQW